MDLFASHRICIILKSQKRKWRNIPVILSGSIIALLRAFCVGFFFLSSERDGS